MTAACDGSRDMSGIGRGLRLVASSPQAEILYGVQRDAKDCPVLIALCAKPHRNQ